MDPLNVVRLAALMDRTLGRPEISVGLIDGPVLLNHPNLATHNIREIPGKIPGTCAHAQSTACMHGTFVAGILCARRGTAAPAICPNCTFFVRPIFSEASDSNGMPSATPEEMAEAIVDSVDAGARVLNLSAALAQPSAKGEKALQQALDYAAGRGVIPVAASGNQGMLATSVITRHPSVIPVAACDLQGRPLAETNLGSVIGRRGLLAPGRSITSLGTGDSPQTFDGSSAAAPFVTGAIALVWSEFPKATSSTIRWAVTQQPPLPRRAIVPPVLDGWAAYQTVSGSKWN